MDALLTAVREGEGHTRRATDWVRKKEGGENGGGKRKEKEMDKIIEDK